MKQEEFRKDVARRLKYFRNLKGVSAKQMSIDIGKSEGYISKIEAVKSTPSIEGFASIVKYIGITCDFFFSAKI